MGFAVRGARATTGAFFAFFMSVTGIAEPAGTIRGVSGDDSGITASPVATGFMVFAGLSTTVPAFGWALSAAIFAGLGEVLVTVAAVGSTCDAV